MSYVRFTSRLKWPGTMADDTFVCKCVRTRGSPPWCLRWTGVRTRQHPRVWEIPPSPRAHQRAGPEGLGPDAEVVSGTQGGIGVRPRHSHHPSARRRGGLRGPEGARDAAVRARG